MARKTIAGKRICGYGASPEEANQDLAEKLGIRSIAPKPLTLHDVARSVWYPHVETLEPLTKKRYAGVYVNHIRGALGEVPIKEIERSTVRNWLGTIKPPGTKRYAYMVLRTILYAAINDGIIGINPCARMSLPTGAKKRHRIMEVDAAAELLENCRGTVLAAPIFLATVLGLRRGEVAALKWKHLDRLKRELRIEVQRQGVTNQSVIEKEVKRGSQRTLRLPKAFIEEIDQRGDLDSEYICTYNGKPWIPDTITEKWDDFRTGTHLSEWRFHDLRHQAAGLLASAGCDLLVIAAVLGHKKPDMTLHYLTVMESRRKEGEEAWAHIFSGKTSTIGVT